MDQVLMNRLLMIGDEIKKLTDCALTQSANYNHEEKTNACVIAAKLKTMLGKFGLELHTYFNTSQEPDIDEVSTLTTIQLHGEEALVELEVKIELGTILQNGATTSGTSAVLSSKLPKLSLPIFEGDILNWHQFWDQFSSNIDKRNLPDVDKLLYLKGSLTGEAKNTIEGLDATNKNYQIAVSLLKQRYGKDSQVIDAHYAAMYKIEPAKTSADYRKTLNEIERHLRVLSSMGEDVNHNHLRFLIMEKFPAEILYDLKMKLSNESVEEIRNKLELIITAKEGVSKPISDTLSKDSIHYTTEALYVKDNQFGYRNNHMIKRGNILFKPKTEGSTSSNFHPKRRRSHCIFCQGAHFNDQCYNFKGIEERKARIQNLCLICFKSKHPDKACSFEVKCPYCKQRGVHNRALCPKKFQTSTNTLHACLTQKGYSILQTAIANIYGQRGEPHKCRILFDTGSQRSYVTEELAKTLNLPTIETDCLSVFTFGSKSPQEIISPVVKLNIKTRTNYDIVLYANVVITIAHNIPCLKTDLRQYIENGVIADDGSLSENIDVLIGNDYYYSLMLSGKIKLAENFFLIESKLGWIPSGSIHERSAEALSVITYFQSSGNTRLSLPDPPLDNGNLKLLWDLESIGITDPPNVSRDEEAVRQFNENTEIINNRYVVCWPWNEYPPNLMSNFGLSFGRLKNLLKRIDSKSLRSYNETLRVQLEAGVIEVIPTREKMNHPVHYLPHHGVSSPGKPIRIVYDASAKTKDNKSLNQCLYCGPLMLEDLTGLLVKFRCHPIGISADVEKAFLQIGLQEKDRDVTRFLWLKDISKPVDEENLLHLRFTRVPFGVISSPFLLNATIKHHLQRSNINIAKEISDDIYVDNLVTGVTTLQEARELYTKTKEVFKDISMNLRMWSSNSKEFMQQIVDTSEEKSVKLLGLEWHLEEDLLTLRHQHRKEALTKRGILKVIASIYDPCGYAVPTILPAKILLQDLWKAKVTWDAPLSKENILRWNEIQKNLDIVQKISVPRCYFKNSLQKECQMHCFTDSSMKAYAAVVYLVQKHHVSFVIGKSRLSPLKDQENLKIPRLELLGVLIGSRLIKYTVKHLKLNITQQYLWTDSQIVISWCNSDKLLSPFVARRVNEIKSNKNLIIRYVPSQINPADVATRSEISQNEIDKWLKGPEFLKKNINEWPIMVTITNSCLAGEDLTKSNEEKTVGLQTSKETTKGIEQNSDVNIRIKEIQESTLQTLKNIQSEYFPEETQGNETNLSRNLGLFKDIDDILRCKGRLRNADWSFDKRYPILIPKDCEFTDNVIMTTHEKNYHVGANHTLSIIRQTYWIPQGKSKVQKMLKKCNRCIKHGGGPFKLPPTPALPPERVNFSKPYTFTGIDYLGPILVNTTNGPSKRWICLFTCLAIRAIHLEVVHDLTAEEGLLALRRMISTRGVPTLITSDNALHFKLISEIVSKPYCVQNQIHWRFIPELAPWFGGFYERLVGLVKHCMKRTLQKHLLKDTQLMTVMKEIEAILNTRPLTAVDNEVEQVLTPADFLTAGRCITLIDSQEERLLEGTATKVDLVKSWRRARIILEEFKEMFSNQYLPSLRERYWNSHKEPRILWKELPKVGQIVQIKENKNREDWKVGKIISLIRGSDGQCRIAKVKVENSVFTRSITHLYPLEIEDAYEEPVLPSSAETMLTKDKDEITIAEVPIVNTRDTLQEIPLTSKNFESTEFIETNSQPIQEIDLPINGAELIVGDNTLTNEISNSLDEHTDKRPLRAAKTQALKKIREWTKELTNQFLFSSGRECRERSRNH